MRTFGRRGKNSSKGEEDKDRRPVDEVVEELRGQSRNTSSKEPTSALDLDKKYISDPSLPSIKTPEGDFRTYERVKEALEPDRLRKALVRMRSEIGTLGFSTQNSMSELSHEGIAREVQGDKEEVQSILENAREVWREFKEHEHHLPKAGRTQFGNNAAQELVELELFVRMFPVVRGNKDEMPELPSVRKFEEMGVHFQAVLAGYKDVVSELSKGVLELTADQEVSFGCRLELNRRWLVVAESAILVLKEFKGLPNSVTQNFFGSRNSWSDGMRWLNNLVIKNRKHYETLLSQKQLFNS